MVFGPLGPGRDDVLAAMQSLYVIRAAGAKDQKIADYLPRWGQTREVIDGVDQKPADQAGGSG